jgi:predicted phage terminase large subunit-like protein
LYDLELWEEQWVRAARQDFLAFRRIMHPDLLIGWFVEDISYRLQGFFDQLTNGERPRLAISTPPQHGKSILVVDFIAWAVGRNPDLRTIFGSFSERLGVRANLALQRLFDSPKYQRVFPETRISPFGTQASEAGIAIRNRELLEIAGRDGFFRNTTVLGSVTGESSDLGIIDDAVKGRAEANSATSRGSTFEWLINDFSTRFSEEAGLLIVMTRWHLDDIVGRLREQLGDRMEVVNYPALAVEDEKYRKAGDPLFPQLKSGGFLLEQQTLLGTSNFEALYQGNPQLTGGNIIKGAWFPRYKELPSVMSYRLMVVDTAITAKEHSDYTVAQVWGVADGKAYLIDQWRAKVEAQDIKPRLLDFWAKHNALSTDINGHLRAMEIEEAASGHQLVQELKRRGGIPVKGIRRSKSKYDRYCDCAGYMEAGSVVLPESAPFVADLIAEMEAFTADDGHVNDDQVDCVLSAIESILLTGTSIVSLWENMT